MLTGSDLADCLSHPVALVVAGFETGTERLQIALIVAPAVVVVLAVTSHTVRPSSTRIVHP